MRALKTNARPVSPPPVTHAPLPLAKRYSCAVRESAENPDRSSRLLPMWKNSQYGTMFT